MVLGWEREEEEAFLDRELSPGGELRAKEIFLDGEPLFGWETFLDRGSSSGGERSGGAPSLGRKPFLEELSLASARSVEGSFLDWEPFLNWEAFFDWGTFLDREAFLDWEFLLDELSLEELSLDESSLDGSLSDESPLDESSLSEEESRLEDFLVERGAGDFDARCNDCCDGVGSGGGRRGSTSVPSVGRGVTRGRNGRGLSKSTPGIMAGLSMSTPGVMAGLRCAWLLLCEGLARSSTTVSRAGSSGGRRRAAL